MHSVGFVDAEDFNLRKHKYRSWLAYSNSKLAQVTYLLKAADKKVAPFEMLVPILYL
jgi:hypothetical protein